MVLVGYGPAVQVSAWGPVWCSFAVLGSLLGCVQGMLHPGGLPLSKAPTAPRLGARADCGAQNAPEPAIGGPWKPQASNLRNCDVQTVR